MNVIKKIVNRFVFLCFIVSSNLSLAQNPVPESLSEWIPWVLVGSENLTCPFINHQNYDQLSNHVCAWPSILTLDATNSGAKFSQSWQVMTTTIVPLLGDIETWPQNVTVNGNVIPVINRKGKPTIELLKGNYQVKGEFLWSQLPESLYVPKQYAFVEMTINGQAISFPKVEGNELWLKELKPDQHQQNLVDVTVNRRVIDGDYIQLNTIISVDVSGKMREVELGKALPIGFELININSDVPAFLDAQGILHAKLKPGNWQIVLNAYAKVSQLSWQRPIQSHYWPKDEIWFFQGQENMRLGKVSGTSMVDNSQTNVPSAWYDLPSYFVGDNSKLTFTVQHRGKPLHLENQLSLDRTLWLSFDHEKFTFNDHITGSMVNDWRLSMQAPYVLESAKDKEGTALVTTIAEGERGIENRYPNVNVQASGVVGLQKSLLISGWKNNFERVSLTMHLPPGNKLFAVFGADSVSHSWWSSWSIWSSFIILFSALVASRLINIRAGIVTVLMFLFVYQEASTPVIVMINLLLAIAIEKHQPFEKLKSIVKSYWLMSSVAAVGAILFFSVTQFRTVIYPQLESKTSLPYYAMASFSDRSSSIKQRKEAQIQEQRNIVTSQRVSKQRLRTSEESVERTEMIKITGSRIKRSDLMERYQADAVLQTGSGLPDWHWNSYQINWQSPVAKGQDFDLIILSKNMYRIVKIIGILLCLLWLYLLLKSSLARVIGKVKGGFVKNNANKATVKSSVAQVLMVFALIPLVSIISSLPVQANAFPDEVLLEALKKQVTKAPLCAPYCASINTLNVKSDANTLTLSLVIHASSDTAVALPKSEFWRPEVIVNNKKRIDSVFKRSGWIYIPVQKGINHIKLKGAIAPVEIFQLHFKNKPQFVELLTNDAWHVVGVKKNVLSSHTLEFVATAQQIEGDTKVSSRYTNQPFVRVSRALTIDQQWRVFTTVERIAPASGAINVMIPLLNGEHVTSRDNSGDNTVDNNQILITLAAGENSVSWHSTIKRQAQLSLHAVPNNKYVEHWQLTVSPAWHAKLSGLPLVIIEQSPDDYYAYSFYPYEDEILTVDIDRPEAVKGNSFTIDSVEYAIDQGSRTAKLSLEFDYRSSRGAEHIIELPSEYQLKEVRTDGKLINIQLSQGKLAIPVLPGKHNVQISMRANTENAILLTSPLINLNAPVSNIINRFNLSQQRWVLWVNGPVLGPAVLYWGELLAFVFIALMMTRVKFSPLNTKNWIILGVGLSLNAWSVLMLLVVWFASLSASVYRPKDIKKWAFNLSQLILYALSIVAIVSLIAVVPISLLGTPDMGIIGNSSYGNHLKWFSDQSQGILPQVSVVSISTLFYKGVMLVWVIWLSFAILNWLKWAWKKLGFHGFWYHNPKKSNNNLINKNVKEKK